MRAVAITAVVMYHVVVMSPVPRPWWYDIAALGRLGVDLFFVLSGWLVGGLYWRELRATGHVHTRHFMLRRILRTVPPYYVALLIGIAFVTVLQPQRAVFDAHYLVFLQNYGPITFFNASWSLCVEEHFYVMLPVFLWWMRRNPTKRPALLPLLAGLPTVGRLLTGTAADFHGFDPGYYASHVHCEALILGVWASWLATYEPQRWRHWGRVAHRYIVLVPAVLAATHALPGSWLYAVGFLISALCFIWWLCAVAEAEPPTAWVVRTTHAIALGTFSTYLTHGFAIQAARAVVSRMHFAGFAESLYFAIAVVSVFTFATTFYWFIEAPLLRMRNSLLPDFSTRRVTFQTAAETLPTR